jgi:carbonic anhydrase
MRTQTKNTQDNLTPKMAHHILIEGNNRFVKNLKFQRNLLEQVLETRKGQYPFAVILSCIDSRVPVEIVFDQGIGDVFSVRVAGNVINEDILGSMEYACKVAGSKIIVVMGHSKCGAVTAACNKVELGNITSLLSKIKPSVDAVIQNDHEITDNSIESVAEQNVHYSIKKIREESPILLKMEDSGQIELVAAMYDVASGRVNFF